MTYLKVWLAVFLVYSSAVAQVCVVGSTEPPAFYSDGLPVVWPKTVSISAPQYVGYVDYYVYCGYVAGVNEQYFSCPYISQDSDISTAADNWSAASSSNGSTVTFNLTSEAPNNTGSCGPTPCFPTYTPYIEFIQEQQADIALVDPAADALTTSAFWDYGCQSPLCPYQIGPYYRLSAASVVFSMDITNDHYLQHIATHEIGHTMVLDDCDGCDTTTTAMTTHTIVLNDPTQGLTSPGYCDNLQVSNSDVALRQPSPLKPNSTVLASSDAAAKSSGMAPKKRGAGRKPRAAARAADVVIERPQTVDSATLPR